MLALVGSGEYLPDVDLIDTTLIDRLGEPARVVCLPTAAGTEGDAMINSWMQRGVDHFTRLGAEVTALKVWNRDSAQNQAFADAIRQANFVYMSGGKPGYLADCYANSPVWRAIVSVHQNGGVVAGCSAGAMIMGQRISGPGGSREGFNLVPGTLIIPHFDEFIGIASRIMRRFSDKSITMVGIDGRTALVKNSDGYEVLGSGQVSIFGPNGTTKHRHGPIPSNLLPNV